MAAPLEGSGPVIKKNWIARGGEIDIDAVAKEGVQFRGWNNKEYIIRSVSANPLASGANGSVYKIEVYVKKFDAENNLIALKPKTLIAKVNNQDKHSRGETATLEVLHGGSKQNGINVWYTTLKLRDRDQVEKDWIILKNYTYGSLSSLVAKDHFIQDNQYRQQVSATIIPQLLEGFRRILDTNVANIDIKTQNVLLRDGKFIEGVLSDMGKSPQIPTVITYENIEQFEDINDLAHTQLYVGCVTPFVILDLKKDATNLASQAKDLKLESERLIREGHQEEGLAKLNEADALLAQAQVPLQRCHALIRTVQKTLIATIVTNMLLGIRPFEVDGMPKPHTVEQFKLKLGNLLSEKGMDSRWESVINELLSEIPNFDDLINFKQNGTTTLTILEHRGGPKTVEFISDARLEAIDKITETCYNIRDTIIPNRVP